VRRAAPIGSCPLLRVAVRRSRLRHGLRVIAVGRVRPAARCGGGSANLCIPLISGLNRIGMRVALSILFQVLWKHRLGQSPPLFWRPG
jgi:hypothetical protein